MREEKKTGAARTQQATRNEEWSDDRLKACLDVLPPQGMPADYNILLRAYRGMTAELFARFIPFYMEAGHDINISLADGSTFLDLLSRHRKSGEYAEILKAAGATSKP
ncbi:MAG: PA4642 family protein [Pseudohongiellaceae bacterium]